MTPWIKRTLFALLGAALLAGGLGSGLTWHTHTLGASLQTGLACALAVFGLGIAVSSFLGRTGAGTVFLAIVTAALLGGAAAMPRDITILDANRIERVDSAGVAQLIRHAHRQGLDDEHLLFRDEHQPLAQLIGHVPDDPPARRGDYGFLAALARTGRAP